MPMTPELRRGIDRIRDYLFGGGYPNPAQNAEQLSFLIYFYMYEAADAARARAAQRPGAEPYASAFDGEWRLRDPRNAREPGAASVPRELLRWSSWAHALTGERLVNGVREEVFPFHGELAANGVTDFMDGARLVIDEPTMLTQVVSQLNDLHLDRVDADAKGDLFEHVLLLFRRRRRERSDCGEFPVPSLRRLDRSAIMTPDGAVRTRIYDPDMRCSPIDLVACAGDELSLWWKEAASPDGPGDRPIDFTSAMTAGLGRLTAVVISASGTGSIQAEQAARLGFGRVILIDFDKVKKKNLNRILNATRIEEFRRVGHPLAASERDSDETRACRTFGTRPRPVRACGAGSVRNCLESAAAERERFGRRNHRRPTLCLAGMNPERTGIFIFRAGRLTRRIGKARRQSGRAGAAAAACGAGQGFPIVSISKSN